MAKLDDAQFLNRCECGEILTTTDLRVPVACKCGQVWSPYQEGKSEARDVRQ